VFDLDFQGHTMKIEFFIITVGFFDPENISLRNIQFEIDLSSFQFDIFEDAIDIKNITSLVEILF
jgi:hypothetical protein